MSLESRYALEADEFLTERMKKPVFRVRFDPFGEQQKKSLFSDCAPYFAFARLGADKPAELLDFVSNGYQLVETSLLFAVNPFDSLVRSRQTHDSITISRASAEHADEIASLAQTAFTHSRFHIDANIEGATADTIKRDWAKNLAMGERGVCYLARDSSSPAAKIDGFIGMVSGKDEETKSPYVAIDLIAVDSRSRGKGVGRALIETALSYASNSCGDFRAGTQSTNLPAIKLYLSVGMRLKNVHFVLHYHC